MLLAASLMSPLGVVAQSFSESLLTTENAYNPMPSPDGKHIAFVRVGWGESGVSSFGRSSLVSDVKVMSVGGAAVPHLLAKGYFLSGWTPDSVRLVCFRDSKYVLVSISGEQSGVGRIPNDPKVPMQTERAAYSSSLETMIWSRPVNQFQWVIEAPGGTVVEEGTLGSGRAIPSPDGQYLAVFDDGSETNLRVYDLRRKSWKKLGRINIHPDRNWSYIQPDWSPWFSDSSRLVFLRDSTFVIVTPDGRDKTEIKIEGRAGLPTPSPDGKSIAYATFEPRPMKVRPDLQFWGGTTIMVVSTSTGSKPRPVTLKNSDEVYDLKWLNNGAIVFDRVADEQFYGQARIWAVREVSSNSWSVVPVQGVDATPANRLIRQRFSWRTGYCRCKPRQGCVFV
jgi:WD40 repeat protein